MTTRTRTILLAVIVIAAALLGCVDLDTDRTEWQNDVLERQRHEGQPGPVTPAPEEAQ